METSMPCVLKDGNTIRLEHDLHITFRRTIRVPDNDLASFLPPDLGKFPLARVSDHADKLPKNMVAKGGLFFTMYQREAMWINFECKKPFLIKIYVGGVNAVSGEPAVETLATTLRRRTILSTTKEEKEKSRKLQDYVVPPKQDWLDGIATADGIVRQFVAMPFGSGYSVEAQVTGQETTGGLQFEVTLYDMPYNYFPILIVALPNRRRILQVRADMTIQDIKGMIHRWLGCPPDIQRPIYRARPMEDGRTIGSYCISADDIIHVFYRLKGGGGPQPELSAPVTNVRTIEVETTQVETSPEMGIAPGGKIKQVIKNDDYPPKWLPSRTTVFNVQILNSAMYREVTGKDPPPTSVNASTYAKHGFPFFKLYEEPSGVFGKFSTVKSIAEIDNKSEAHVSPRVVHLNSKEQGNKAQPQHDPGLTNPAGPLRSFRTVHDLEKELADLNIAEFDIRN